MGSTDRPHPNGPDDEAREEPADPGVPDPDSPGSGLARDEEPAEPNEPG